MNKWELVSETKVYRDRLTEEEQRAVLGYSGRTISTLRCPYCRMHTMVDSTILYEFCPHCGKRTAYQRLTERDEYGNADIIALSDVMPEIYAGLSFSETNALMDALNKLADYEDREEKQ